jgi:hypothetical protein
MMKLAISPRDPKFIDELKRMLKEEWNSIMLSSERFASCFCRPIPHSHSAFFLPQVIGHSKKIA